MASIRYIIWKKDNSAIITFDPNEILKINKDEIRSISKENGVDRTYTTNLYVNSDIENPETIIQRYNSIYQIKTKLIEPYLMTDIDKNIIHNFNKN
jgi:hypothetical protein